MGRRKDKERKDGKEACEANKLMKQQYAKEKK